MLETGEKKIIEPSITFFDEKNQDKAISDVTKNKKGIFDISILEHRERVSAAKPLIEPANIPFLDLAVPIAPNVKIPVRIYVPKNIKPSKIPTLFYFPGTAFIANETKFTRVICSHIAKQANCQVIVINPRLAPENQAPDGYLDAFKAFKFFVCDMPDHYMIDRSKIAISGYSSGGNYAALVAFEAKKANIHINRQILISPIVDLSRSLKGFKEFEEKDTDISEEFVNFFISQYLPENKSPRSAQLSPFWKKQNETKGLPPTDIILAEYDRFRSDAEFYYLKLTEADVPVDKFTAGNAKHSYLWYQLEITEKIAERASIAFQDNSLTLLKPSTLSYLKPQISAKKKEEKEITMPKAKL